jgi:hypothetical protein
VAGSANPPATFLIMLRTQLNAKTDYLIDTFLRYLCEYDINIHQHEKVHNLLALNLSYPELRLKLVNKGNRIWAIPAHLKGKLLLGWGKYNHPGW